MAPIRDQQALGSCWAVSTAETLEGADVSCHSCRRDPKRVEPICVELGCCWLCNRIQTAVFWGEGARRGPELDLPDTCLGCGSTSFGRVSSFRPWEVLRCHFF